MPSAFTGADGQWSMGYSFDRPYASLWTSVTILPALEFTGTYTSVIGAAPRFADQGYGRYKDKVIGAKLQLIEEGKYNPAFSLGKNDIFGTELFKSNYLVASKHIGSVEFSLGSGTGRINGLFAGARWVPTSYPNWSFVMERDVNNYKNDFRSSTTFAAKRTPGTNLGLEYRWGWLSLQLANQRSHSSINAMVNIPMNEREFVPKFQEPSYFSPEKSLERPSAAEWRADPQYKVDLIKALQKQNYQLISTDYESGAFQLRFTNSRISNLGRSIGRAVRTALYFMPRETRTLKVTYTEREIPIATYEFFEISKLQDYLNGRLSRSEFKDFYLLRSADDFEDIHADADQDANLHESLKEPVNFELLTSDEGDVVQLRHQDALQNKFKLYPKLGFYFNDPSGALHYNLDAFADYERRLAKGLYFSSSVGATLLEDVSKVQQPSNSLLPHVRTDVADYKRGSKMKIYRSLINQYLKPGADWYGRLSAGIYEEMYAGVGGQLLYAPAAKRWAADISVDSLKQRDYQGFFGFRHYSTTTALASIHYRFPYGVTTTMRAGRFLAGDTGARFEVKRRFKSGMEFGAWYTLTNGHDITNPGTPSSPYNDKGIFFKIPLSAMLTTDSKSSPNFSLSPWTRDVGQMVSSPGDLYELQESVSRDMGTFDGLGDFAERVDEHNSPEVAPPVEYYNGWPQMHMRLDDSYSALPSFSSFSQEAIAATSVIATAALLDKLWNKKVKQYGNNKATEALDRFSEVMPFIGAGLAGSAVLFGDDRLKNTGLISLQSAVASGFGSMALKKVVNRSRPESGDGYSQKNDNSGSFPSNHSAVVFSLVTPFASEYDAPWLYGVAGLAAISRTAEHKHWLSDTVAGSLLGYSIGKFLWRAQRNENKYQASVAIDKTGVGFSFAKQY